MKTSGHRRPPRAARSSQDVRELRARLSEAEETLRAIRSGGVDALMVAGSAGLRVYTLKGAERAYRLLIESMNEGALMLSPQGLILYANRRFATMLRRPLGRVMGASFYRFLSDEDRKVLRPLLKRSAKRTASIHVNLRATARAPIPAQISVRALARDGVDSATFSMVVTDMTEARRSERILRILSHGLLQAQESDRRRLAVALHDRAGQSLGGVLFSLRVLAGKLPRGADALREEVGKISEQVGKTAEVVEEISKNLRPSVLEILGLVPALRAATAEFVKRTGIAVALACAQAPAGLSAEGELVLYRILEAGLKNVETHAETRSATVHLRQGRAVTELRIKDDGVGFDIDRPPVRRQGTEGMSLVGLRERVAYVGGTLTIRSSRGAGTEVVALIPRAPGVSRRTSA